MSEDKLEAVAWEDQPTRTGRSYVYQDKNSIPYSEDAERELEPLVRLSDITNILEDLIEDNRDSCQTWDKEDVSCDECEYADALLTRLRQYLDAVDVDQSPGDEK